MKIIKNEQIVEDSWCHVDDGAPLPEKGDVTVSSTRFSVEKAELAARSGRIGIRVAPDQDASSIAGLLSEVALVAIEFPKFTDGRGYSTARLLRDRYGYRGELRAVGHVLRDQLDLMRRCGMDAFELAPGQDVEQALSAFDEIPVQYQPAS